MPESLLTIDSSDDEVYTDSITSHTTASDSTIGNLTSPLGPISSRVDGPKVDSKTESQFSSSMPFLEESTPLIDINDIPSAINVSDSHDSVFVSDPSPDISILKYAGILWNRTFGCIRRQAFNYYCSLLQV